jgi:hypothetical protein
LEKQVAEKSVHPSTMPRAALILSKGRAKLDLSPFPFLVDVPYLIKRFQVSYIPSASVFVAQSAQERKEKRPQRLPLLAFGDPVYSGERSSKAVNVDSRQIANVAVRSGKFQRLKFSGNEVRRIARIWNVSQFST